MSSKHCVQDVGKYLIGRGVSQALLGHGILGSVHEILKDGVVIKTDSGVLHTICYDVCQPTPTVVARTEQWKKLFADCYKRCAPIRFLNLHHANGCTWTLREDSFVLKQGSQLLGTDARSYRMFELCCGGFGGWSRAASWMNRHLKEQRIEVVGATDKDPSAIEWWVENNVDHSQVPCFVGDITTLQTWDNIISTSPNCACLSSPCQSFSSAGRQDGFFSENGAVLALGIFYAAIHGLDTLLLENVSALKYNQEHWSFFNALIEYCGYQVVYADLINIGSVHPINRSRLIALLIRKGDHGIAKIDLDFKFDAMNVSCIAQKRWLDIPRSIVQSLVIPDHILDEYSAFFRLPKSTRSSTYSKHKNAVLDQRTLRPFQTIPSGCGMARYQSQHDLPGEILGMIRILQDGRFRFLHAGEVAIAMGCVHGVSLPVRNEHAMMIIGNSISEAHSLIGLKVMLDATLQKDSTMIHVSVAELLEKHRDECLKSHTISWDIDDAQVQICNRRIFRIFTCADDTIQPPISVKIPKNAKVAQLLQAEAQMHPSNHKWGWKHHEAMTNAEQMIIGSDAMCIESRTNRDYSPQSGVVICWNTGTCHLPISPVESIADWEIMGWKCGRIQWTDGEDNPWCPTQPIGYTDVLFTDHDFAWPESIPKNKILVVHVMPKCVAGQVISFSQGETVESLAHAEQIMVGPNMKIVKIQDRFACDIERTCELKECSVVALHFENREEHVELLIHGDQSRITKRIQKGTRIFEVMPPQHGLHLVDGEGYVIPWDLPIFRDWTLRLKSNEVAPTVEISPTIEYVSEEHEPKDQRNKESIQNMVQNVTSDVQTQMIEIAKNCGLYEAQTKSHPPRIEQLCNFGPMMGDDEMTHHLENMDAHSTHRIVGIIEWEDSINNWQMHPIWTNKMVQMPSSPVAFVLHVQSHWIAGLFGNENQSVIIWDNNGLSISQGAKLLDFLRCKRENGLCRKSIEDAPGFCGFMALMTLQNEIMSEGHACKRSGNSIPLSTLVPYQMVIRYQLSVNKCQNKELLMFLNSARMEFIERQIRSPTSARYHAGAPGQHMSHAQLKLNGTVASILISKGHASDEAVRVAQQLSEKNPAKLKGLASMTDAKGYAFVLEACIAEDIKLANVSKHHAVQRIQQFFRSQRQKRPKAQNQVNIHQLEFAPKTWMIMNGEYVNVSPSWSPVSRGIAVADVSQISVHAMEATLLTNEANSVITSESVQCQKPITSEEVVVPVMDKAGGQALVRLYVTHFGAKKVIRAPAKDAIIDLPACRTIALTMYKEMTEESMWQQLVQSPVKTVLSVIRDKPNEMEILQVWSRRWGQGAVGDPMNASCFSFLASINAASLPKWLSCSGLTNPPVFVTGKRNQGEQMTQSNRVIWCGKSISLAISAATRLDQHLGVVFKPPSSYGLRVASEKFEESWKILKESDQTPAHVSCDCKYILSALPKNISGPSLEKWGEALGWKIRVLKRFQDNRFLIGSPNEPPHVQLSLDGSEVLIQEYQEQPKPTNQIIAGRLHSDSTVSEENDPWLGKKLGSTQRKHNDPVNAWDRYVPTGGVARSSNDANPSEERLSKVEQDLAQLKDHINQSQAANQEQFKQMDNKISTLNHSLKASLQEALSDQSAALIKTFESLMKSPRAKPMQEEENRSRSPKPKGGHS